MIKKSIDKIRATNTQKKDIYERICADYEKNKKAFALYSFNNASVSLLCSQRFCEQLPSDKYGRGCGDDEEGVGLYNPRRAQT